MGDSTVETVTEPTIQLGFDDVCLVMKYLLPIVETGIVMGMGQQVREVQVLNEKLIKLGDAAGFSEWEQLLKEQESKTE